MIFCGKKRRSTALYILAAFNSTLAVLTCVITQRVTATSSLIALCAFVEYAWARTIDCAGEPKAVYHLPDSDMVF
jgi:hypothetical protein